MVVVLIPGAMMGNVIALPLSGVLCQFGFSQGWDSIFYVIGRFNYISVYIIEKIKSVVDSLRPYPCGGACCWIHFHVRRWIPFHLRCWIHHIPILQHLWLIGSFGSSLDKYDMKNKNDDMKNHVYLFQIIRKQFAIHQWLSIIPHLILYAHLIWSHTCFSFLFPFFRNLFDPLHFAVGFSDQ